MSPRPTIYLANFASRRTPGMWGAAYAPLTIMTRPRWFERGCGRVPILVPTAERDLLLAALADRSNVAAMNVYRGVLETRWATEDMRPGRLSYVHTGPMMSPAPLTVISGMTLCCACSVAEARAGRCHRAWAAPFLHAAGWRVVLDGREWAPGGVKDV